MARFSFYPLATTLLLGGTTSVTTTTAFVPPVKHSSSAFTVSNQNAKNVMDNVPSHLLFMASSKEESTRETTSVVPRTSSTSTSDSNRRSFLSKAAGSSVLLALGLVDAPEEAKALGSLKKVNAKLVQYGVPIIEKVPDGFSPLAEIWGRGKNRDALLVTFVHPLDWIVTLPSQDVNGEDGTIQAGEYGKGDTATFFVYSDVGKVENLADQPKQFFETALIKSISQKGDNLYQNFKVTKVMPKKVDGEDYVICEFKYSLLTGAGFEVDRIGLASVTSTGNNVEVLWAASTRQRFKKTEGALMTIVDSFRCYSGGLDMAKIDYGDAV